ncbi:hypothetical protein LCGC14_2424990 [marine sediment metagenome]|uniref:Uncharacterized protein n=1 Tax=marine sediment metagenome TaxID=412755 RepID=A0A0F9CAS0_9ZZZZ
MNIQIIPGVNFDAQLKNGVLKEATRLIGVKALVNFPAIKAEIGQLLIRVFLKTEVVRSLLGGGSTDLSAHLGLRPGEAAGLVDGMKNILQSSVSMVTSTKRERVVQIRAVEADFGAFRTLPSASHINRRSGILIPVIDWMLIDPDIDIGQAAYDIVFSGDFGGKFDATIQQGSRSRKAIMVALETLSGGSSYVLPAILRQSGGKNFIEAALRQQGVVNEIGKILFKRLR